MGNGAVVASRRNPGLKEVSFWDVASNNAREAIYVFFIKETAKLKYNFRITKTEYA